MGDTKEFSINWPNRIKYEKEGDFKNSLFSDVYKKAEKYVRDIIEDNGREKRSPEQEAYCNDENFNNIIPFLGERGMGKTSAMVSFALSLQESDKYMSDKGRIGFYLLPRIDIGMLVKGENLLDIILAKMWTSFETKMNQENGFDPITENLKNSFANVKKWYQLYVESMKGKEKTVLTSTRELKELSKCLNLVDALKQLVESYLHYMQKDRAVDNYMVITLDDLDVATENVYMIMEQIRLFLNLPNVIVLVSADIGRLFIHYTKFFTEMLLPANISNNNENQTEQIGRYVEGYLAKTFPHNRRIYLPEVSSLYENEYDIKDKKINQDSEKNIRRLEYKIIYNKAGILWYPFDSKQDALYNASLRKIVNDLNELRDIAQLDDSAHAMLNWLIRKIEEFARNKMDYNLQKFISEMNAADCSYLGNILSQYSEVRSFGFAGNIFRNSTDAESEGYGKVLADIYDIYRYHGNQADEECRIALLYFAILTSKEQLKSPESFEKFYKGTIFQYILKRSKKSDDFDYAQTIPRVPLEDENNTERAEEVINPTELSIEAELKKTQNNDTYDEIYKAMLLTMLCCKNIENLQNMWNYREKTEGKEAGETTKKESKEKTDNNDGIIEEQKEPAGFTVAKEYNELTPSLDYLLNNLCNYEEFLSNFISGLSQAIQLTDDKDKAIIDAIKDNPCFRLEPYREWKRKYHIESMIDFLPLRSTEIMLHIADRVSRTTIPEGATSSMADAATQRIWLQMRNIVQELKTIDNYYGFEGARSNALKVQEVIDIFKPIQ